MDLRGLHIGFAMTGSFCSIRGALKALKALVETGANVIPIVSGATGSYNTRFTEVDILLAELEKITGNAVLKTIVDAEPIGPKALLDALVICPCTGNTLAKLANAITDTSVTMAAKAHLRNDRPVVIAVSTNDGLGGNAKNIGELLNMKNIYFVPFYQDDPVHKSKSLMAKLSVLQKTLELALEGKQIQPLIEINE